MNSSELLRLQLSKNLECSRIGYASGPTGPTGPTGDTGPIGPAGYPKVYTFFLDFVASGINGILSRIYIPPGFSTDPRIANGGIFTADIPGLLIFFGLNTITIYNTTYNFPVGITGTGYANTSIWAPCQYTNIGTTTGIRWKHYGNVTNLNNIVLLGIGTNNFNGTSVLPKYLYIPGTTIPDSIGWLATLTIYYL
jgi:hypothetical protein